MIVIRGLDPRIHRTFKKSLENRMDCRVELYRRRPEPVIGPRRARTPLALSRGNDRSGTSVGPGEGDLVERLRAKLLRGARHHAAAERAIEFGRGFVVGERPD